VRIVAETDQRRGRIRAWLENIRSRILKDIFAFRGDRQRCGILNGKVLGVDERSDTKSATKNTKLIAYLQGHFYLMPTEPSRTIVESDVIRLNEAIRLDPRLALVYAEASSADLLGEI